MHLQSPPQQKSWTTLLNAAGRGEIHNTMCLSPAAPPATAGRMNILRLSSGGRLGRRENGTIQANGTTRATERVSLTSLSGKAPTMHEIASGLQARPGGVP